MQATATETTNLTILPLSLIAPGDNPRKHFDQSELDELTASIRVNGILQPILVRSVEGGYTIVAGERRYRAALQAFGEDGRVDEGSPGADDRRGMGDVQAPRRGSLGAGEDQGCP